MNFKHICKLNKYRFFCTCAIEAQVHFAYFCVILTESSNMTQITEHLKKRFFLGGGDMKKQPIEINI